MASVEAREPIRLLRVIARLNVGGPALHVSYLTKDLASRGYETTLVTGSVGDDEGSMEYIANDLGVEPRFIEQLRRDISVAPDFVATAALRRLIRQLEPDIVHTHTAKAGAVGRAAALAAGLRRRPLLVHTFHGHVLHGYFTPVVTAAFTAVERSLARHTDALIAVSPQIRDDLVRLRVAPAGRIAVVRLGLSLDTRVAADPGARAAVRRELEIADGAVVVGWLGRMTQIKRVDDLLRAFAQVCRRNDTAVLVLVGGGPMSGRLESLARELRIADRCRFVGYRADIARYLAAFDIVALTSANEGTPVSLIEAQAAGVPVVATDVGGTRDVVLDGVTGLLAPGGDVAAIADRLALLVEDDALRRELGAHGPQRTSERYDRPRLADDLDRLYRSLLLERSPRYRRVFDSRSRPLPRALRPPEAKTPIRASRNRLRVVLLSQYFPPEVGATQSRMQVFAEYLADMGHDVTVICEFPNHPRGTIPESYRGMWVEDDRSNPYRVLRVWVMAHRKKTQATRMQFYLSYMGMATAVAPRAGHADVVLATSPPLFTAVAGAAIARMNRAPFVLDVRDLWPAAAVSLDQIVSKVAVRVGAGLEAWLYREAAQTIGVTRPFCEHIDAFRRHGPRSVLIPNGTLDIFFGAKPDGARGPLGGEGRFVVTFAGTHGIAQGLPAVLDAASLLDDSVSMAFVGDGPVRDALIADATERGLENVRFIDQVPLEETPPLLAASDALLVPLSRHPTFQTFVPSKLIDFMAVGRPIILSAAGEAERIVRTAGAGVVVEPEDPAALARAVRYLQEHPDEAREMGQRGEMFARRRLRALQAERLEAVLLDVADRWRARR